MVGGHYTPCFSREPKPHGGGVFGSDDLLDPGDSCDDVGFYRKQTNDDAEDYEHHNDTGNGEAEELRNLADGVHGVS